MTKLTHLAAATAPFPVSSELLAVLHEVDCNRVDNTHSVQLIDRAGRETETITLDVIATKPSYFDFNDIPRDLERGGAVPSGFMWRPIDADPETDDTADQYAPVMVQQPWGITFIEDHSATIGDEIGQLLNIASLSTHAALIGWDRVIADMSLAVTHKPNITFDISQHSVTDNVMGCVMLDSEPFAYVTYSGAGLGMSYVNDPMFSNDVDFIGRPSEVWHAGIIEVAFAHWMACNAAGIGQ